MGHSHSASGIATNRQQLGTKAQRAAVGKARAPKGPIGKPPHAGLGPAYRSGPFTAPPSDVAKVGTIVPKPHQVKPQDGPRCAFCGMGGHALRPLGPFQLPTGETVPACNICAILRRQPARLALPAPRPHSYWRPIRRELVRMTAGIPRWIPTGPVIVLGPGPKPSPYDPGAIQRARAEIKRELEQLNELRENKQPGRAAWQGASNASWEIRNAEQRVQAAEIRLHFLLKAA